MTAERLQTELPPPTLRKVGGIQYGRAVIAKRKRQAAWRHEEAKRKMKVRKTLLYEALCSKVRGDSYLQGNNQKTLGVDVRSISAEDLEKLLAQVSCSVRDQELATGMSKLAKYTNSQLHPGDYWTCPACATLLKNAGTEEQKTTKKARHMLACKTYYPLCIKHFVLSLTLCLSVSRRV